MKDELTEMQSANALNLDEAAEEYAPDFSDSIASKAAVDAIRDAFKAGAKWNMKDIELIIHWFDHIAQIANDRKTANGVVMTPEDALDEIKALARDAAFYVENNK